MRGCDYTGPPSGSPLPPGLSFAYDLRARAAVLMAYLAGNSVRACVFTVTFDQFNTSLLNKKLLIY